MGSRLTYVSAMLIGVVSVLMGYSVYLVTGAGSIWGITTGESKLGGLFWQSLGLRTEQLTYFQQFKLAPPLEDYSQAIVFAILVGGGATALITRSFVVKHLPDRWMLAQAIVGGFLLGYGARLALGCNIGNFLSAWAAGGVHAAIFTAALLPGTYVGLRITERLFASRARPIKMGIAPPGWLQRALGAMLVAVAIGTALLLKPLVAVWWLAGLAFGALGWISSICFASCYRDLVAPRYSSGINVVAVGLAVLVFSTGIFLLQQLGGVPFKLTPPQIGASQILFGGFIFGLGIGVAGSCIFSSEWRAAGGSIYSIVVLASTILLGMPALALHYDWWLSVLPQEPKPFTLYALSPVIGYAAPLAFSTLLIVYGIRSDVSARDAIARWLSQRITLKAGSDKIRG
jgi:uncharacterized membrane protein YedE/YeeE